VDLCGVRSFSVIEMEEKKMSNNETTKILSCKCGNVESELIIITHDKLYNILSKHRKKIGIKAKWVTPLTFFITILMALLTTKKYNKISVITGEYWQVIFIIGAIATFIWFIIMLIKAFKYYNDSTIDSLIDKIKGDKKTKCFYEECSIYNGECPHNAEVLDDIRKGKACHEKDRKESIIKNLESTKCIYIEDCPICAQKPPKKGRVIAAFIKIKASEKFRKFFGI
jgi:hypothetical protein